MTTPITPAIEIATRSCQLINGCDCGGGCQAIRLAVEFGSDTEEEVAAEEDEDDNEVDDEELEWEEVDEEDNTCVDTVEVEVALSVVIGVIDELLVLVKEGTKIVMLAQLTDKRANW